MFINLYGFGDNYYLKNSYVLLVLICCFYEVKDLGVKVVMCWGIGFLLWEFFYVDDFGDVCVFVLENWRFIVNEFYFFNVGIGEDLIIWYLVELIVCIVGFNGDI